MSAPGHQTLGKYEILGVLGKGGMGTVYRARDLLLERIVALKVLHPEHTSDPDAAENWRRFLNEARAIARLNHPAIVSLFQFSDSTPTGTCFAMEYVDGPNIADYVRQHPSARVAVTLDLVCQLLLGLAYAHQQSVVHRDIKPSNLLITREGRVKITDFGVAKLESVKHTQTGFMMGTPGYMSPERYQEGDVDHRCDIYSTGVLCHELLTGKALFNGTLAEIVYQICQVPAALVSTVEPTSPALLDPIIAKSLAKDPAERYQTALEFHSALSAARETLGFAADTELRSAAITTAQLAKLGPEAFPTLLPATQILSPPPGVNASPPREVNVSPPPDTKSTPGWSGQEIAELVELLTPILGPMARIVVKRYAAMTHDRGELYALLALQLHTDDERKNFLAAVSRNSGKTRLPAFAPDVSTKGPDTQPDVWHNTIAPSTLERTTKILARYIGPIAAVVVKKAAPAALDESDLYAKVAERIADADERAQFVADLTEI
ncbi:MAG: serine/threonine protein kinase [Sinobacteraceae bacterium]|nr:serine/threonine protein kinase [Nevskiaceae bacterium]